MYKDTVTDVNFTVIACGGCQKSTTGFPSSFTKMSGKTLFDTKAMQFVIMQCEYHESS